MPTVGVAPPGLDRVRPGAGVALGRGRRVLPGRLAPALQRQLLERRRGRAVDHQHRVVEGRGRCAREPAPRLDRPVLGRVPAPGREVDAADEAEPAVDHDQLLVVAAARRVVAAQREAHPLVGQEAEPPPGQLLAVEAVGQDPVPDQDAELERGPLPGERVEEQVERPVVGVGLEPEVAADVPAQHQHAAPRLEQGPPQGREVGGAVDQRGGPERALEPPAGLAGLQDRGAGPGAG